MDVPNDFYIYGTSKKILVVCLVIWSRGFDKVLGASFTSFFGSVDIKRFAKQVLKSFSGRNNFPESIVFDFPNSLPVTSKNKKS